jgi:hypothetical protein
MPDDLIDESGQRLDDFSSSGTGPVPVFYFFMILLNQILERAEVVQAHLGIRRDLPDRGEIEIELMEGSLGTHGA